MLDKTDKGREEIATRKHGLPPRLRTLLVMIDGKHATVELLKKVSGLGLNEESITELINNGFIHAVSAEPSAKIPVAEANAEPIAAPLKAGAGSPESLAEIAPRMDSQASQYQALYYFYTETIKNTIGLRGYGLQLKIERASSIDDFRDLRQPYLEAVLKAKGNEVARSLADRLDQLLK